MCVLDEFSEYLLETRFNTSADFNTYPIRIFFFKFLIPFWPKMKMGTKPMSGHTVVFHLEDDFAAASPTRRV